VTGKASSGGERGWLRTLSGAPRRDPSGLASYHGARLVLLFALAALTTVLFPRSSGSDVLRYELGSVASEDVIAEFAFPVPKSPEELERERIEAALSVSPTFDMRPEAADSMASNVGRLMDRIEAASASPEQAAERVSALFAGLGIALTTEQVELLVRPGTRDALQASLLSSIRAMVSEGVFEGGALEAGSTEQFKVRVPGESDRILTIDEVRTATSFYEEAAEALPDSLQTSPGQALARLILIRNMRPSYVLNEEAFEAERTQARAAVAPTKANVMTGEAIVRANQQVGPAEAERLDAYREQRRNLGLVAQGGPDLSTILGSFLFVGLILLMHGLVLRLFRPAVYRNFRWLLLQVALAAAYLVIAWVIGQQRYPTQLLPIAFVALASAVLWDGRMALSLVAALAVITGGLPAFASTGLLATTLVAGAAAALSVRVVRRRSQFWVFVGIISAAYAAMALALGLMEGQGTTEIMTQAGWGVMSATASALAAMGFMSLFEWFTGITTDQTLLEWADPNRSLLGRLSREAAGTYAHTIGVANLCEAAAAAIGANGLLCRVGAYYHDVGKVLKPQYFIENQPGGRNPHDKLKPETSASIVREHVTEGLRMAREAGVPEVICDFISQHHGTQTIGFFYEKALEEADAGESVDITSFTYPGPKPQTRETAILMLADSLESATRALHDPTRERIQGLVDNLVEHKIERGQLDEAPLTLAEIALIKEQIVKVLAGMYHTRIDYPTTKHLTAAPTTGARTN